jgi:capsid protein
MRRLRGAFLGGTFNRLTNDWVGSLLSPDQDIWGDFIQLRARARDLEKNNPYAARYLTIASVNVIGPHGMRLQARNKKRTGELDNTVNQLIEEAFADWSQMASVDGRFSWEELQSLIIKTVARDGEVFVRMLTGDQADNEVRFCIACARR